MSAAVGSRIEQAWAVLSAVPDPEIPVLSVCDLGIVREIMELPGGALEVVLTPTYSGCPATEVIQDDIRSALESAGFKAELKIQRSPAWTTDWISPEGHTKLKAYGIAPPTRAGSATCAISDLLAGLPEAVPCPRCGSNDTERLARFGSTPCKALYRCLHCQEPFDFFKPI